MAINVGMALMHLRFKRSKVAITSVMHACMLEIQIQMMKKELIIKSTLLGYIATHALIITK